MRQNAMPTKIDFRYLDAIRGIAALYVCIHHCRGALFAGLIEYIQQRPRAIWNAGDYLGALLVTLTRAGPPMVILFFVVSGFCISHSLRNKPNPGGFYLRRLIRLYPPYIAALGFAFLVYFFIRRFEPGFFSCQNPSPFLRFLCDSEFFVAPTTILKNLVYITSGPLIRPFWSLIHEVFFYLLAPLLLLNKRMYCALSILLYIVSWAMIGNRLSDMTVIGKFVLDYNIYFAVGVAVYAWWPQAIRLFSMKKPVLVSAIMLDFLLLIIVSVKFGEVSKVVFGLGALLAVIFIVNFHTHKLYNRFLGWAGKISYTLYITHYASLFLFAALLYLFTPLRLPQYNFFFWMCGIPFCLCIAYLMYLAVERQTKIVLTRLRS